MKSDELSLFKDKRFLPNFIVQFCGYLNDTVLKSALIILVTYGLSCSIQGSAAPLILTINAVYILPFILFASIAGQVADRYERATLIRIIKLCEIITIMFAIYGFAHNNLLILFSTIGFMGIHSTFFSPIKYSVLPDQLNPDELLAANGFIEASTFIAIFIGSIIGSLCTVNSYFVMTILAIASIIGFIASIFSPRSNNSNKNIKITFNVFYDTRKMVKYVKAQPTLYLAILGIAWFWFINVVIVTTVPLLTKEIFGANEHVSSLLFAIFALGIGSGSFVCNKLFDNEITSKYMFITALGISIFGIDLFFASRIGAINYEPTQLTGILVFLFKTANWRVIIDLFLLSTAGGLYVVPLFAILQHTAHPGHRSRVISVSNLISSIFMAISAIILSLLFYFNFSILYVMLFISLLNIVVAFYIYRLTPEVGIVPFPIIRGIFKLIFDFMYQVEVKGIENFYKAGKRAVIIANHTSYIDPPLIGTYLPEQLIFAINTGISKVFWVKPFMRMAKTLAIDPTNAMAIKTLINEIRQNKKIAIFPEGRISMTGSLMKIYEGPGLIADKADATILPVRIDGTQFTHFSKLKNIIKRKLCPKIIITILPPIKFEPQINGDNRARRKYIGRALYDIMTDMMFESSNQHNTLFQSLIEAAKIHGFHKKIIEDIDDDAATYRTLLFRSFQLAGIISKTSMNEQYIGLMLPNITESLVSFYAIQALGKKPVMINWTHDAPTIISLCRTTLTRQIYSSRKFIEHSNLFSVVNKIVEANIKVIFLEEIYNHVSTMTRIRAYIGSFFPQGYYNKICMDDPQEELAAIIFTAGTEAAPKAVALSHQNLQANRFQLTAKVNFYPHDLAFIALPMFHNFGLAGALMMSLNGIKIFFHPSPLNYRAIPEVIYDVGATILISTHTYLDNYAQYAHPYDFYSVRCVLVTSEKLNAKTRQVWLDKYGIRIFEGYGSTETSSMITINTPMHYQPGTTGRLLSKIEYVIKPLAHEAEVGHLFIKGPNVMLGYITADAPGTIKQVSSNELGQGWFDTGDIVQLDQDGYFSVIKRVKQRAAV